MRGYEELKTDFEIPGFLEERISEFVRYLNESENPTCEDMYREELKYAIKWCQMEPRQARRLEDYYVRGGIYGDGGKPPARRRKPGAPRPDMTAGKEGQG